MRDWVKPFLIQKAKDTLDSIDRWKNEEEKEEAFKMNMQELEYEEDIYYRLNDFFNTHFSGGFGFPKDHFMQVFGSVLADLPIEAFQKLRGMKNLFFAFTGFYGAEVKFFDIESDLKTDERIVIVTFPYSSAFEPVDVMRGAIAHELAHVYAEHVIPEKMKFGDEAEDEADEIPRHWGFEKEIDALRKAEKGRRKAFKEKGEIEI